MSSKPRLVNSFKKFFQRKLSSAYEVAFSEKVGQIVLNDLIKTFHIMDTTAKPGDRPETVMFKEGQRSVVLHIIAMLKLSETDILTQMEQVMKDETVARRGT